MRLTLRTLLAYLDDTLEPLEIKAIGQKVAESEAAEELIARIKQVTRRRRITAPPATGPNSFDPNLVAEYLDNQLSPERVAEVEKICLESDVHLAEVASCHQILTLVLGEPSQVPPTAKERMYALVQGREAIPFRKAATRDGLASASTTADADADEMLLLGLPLYRRGSWLRWALPLAAVVLFAVVGVALWQSILGVQQQPSTTAQVAQNGGTNPQTPVHIKKITPKAPETNVPKNDNVPPVGPSTTRGGVGDPRRARGVKPADKPSNEPKTGGAQPSARRGSPTPPLRPTSEDIPPAKKTEITTVKPSAPAPAGREEPPSTDRVEVGQYHTDTVGPPSLLVQRNSAEDEWQRIRPGARVSTNVQLMSLPGYASEVWLDNGLHLLLRGHVREFTPQLLVKNAAGQDKNEAGQMDYLQECALVLHKPKDTDADLTLERGRLYVSNRDVQAAGTRVVRLRFEKNKVWDLQLHADAEVVVELIKFRWLEQPIALLNLLLLRGRAGLALEGDSYPNLSVPGTAYFLWESSKPSTYAAVNESQQQVDQAARKIFAKKPTVSSRDALGMERALRVVKDLMTLGKSPLVALQQVLEFPGREKPYEHRLAIYCLGAMDELKELMNILGKADSINAPDRMLTIVALRRWLDRGPEQSQKLFDPATGKGLLIDLSYTREEAQRIMQLMRDPSYEQIFTSRDYYEDMAKDLISDKVAIKELARWRLTNLAISMFRLKMPHLEKFNAARPITEGRLAMREVLEKVNEGLLPPPDPNMPRAKGAARPNPKGQRPRK